MILYGKWLTAAEASKSEIYRTGHQAGNQTRGELPVVVRHIFCFGKPVFALQAIN